MLSAQRIPDDREEVSLRQIPRQFVGNFFLFLVAICHQTSPPNRLPLVGRLHGQIRRGWDYLLERFNDAAADDLSLLTPARWAEFSSEEIRVLFRDAEFGDRLSDPELRSLLIKDLGARM